jgi:Amt family ammonium transporter
MLFSALWLTVVYAPLAHMVWASKGLLFAIGAIDFAGGTVVHINAGIAGLVGVMFAGPRIGHLKEAMPPHSLALTMVGAGLLWVGWFGFNAGSALEASGLAGIAMVNTFVAPAAGALAWMGIERVISGKPSMLGGASGAVAGLVAVTPAAGVSGPVGAMLLGAAASLVCYGFVGSVKNRLKLDDSLDVFGIHGLGGIVGSIGAALVAVPAMGGHGGDGYALGHQLLVQMAAVGIAIAWSATGSALCFLAVRRVTPLRYDREREREGLDLSDHGERAYNY